MKEWVDLYRRHRGMREAGGSIDGAIRKRLIQLAERRCCDSTIRSRFTYCQAGKFHSFSIRPRARVSDIPEGSEQLDGLDGLESAWLTVRALVDPRSGRLLKFDAMVQGKADEGQGWLAAVHLDDDGDDRKGSGACGHAAFHCHVGSKMGAVPEVRVPFPDVGPVGALDWLLSLVVPGWEPAPWSEVGRAIEAEE